MKEEYLLGTTDIWAGWDYTQYGDRAYGHPGISHHTDDILESARKAVEAIDDYIQRLENFQKSIAESNYIHIPMEEKDMNEFANGHIKPVTDEIKKDNCEFCKGGKCLCFDEVESDIMVDAFIKDRDLILYFEDSCTHLKLKEITRPILYCPICGRKLV